MQVESDGRGDIKGIRWIKERGKEGLGFRVYTWHGLLRPNAGTTH